MLEGTRILLDPLDPTKDVSEAYVGWLNDPSVFRYLGTKFGQTSGSVRAYVEGIRPPDFIAKIVLRESGLHVGNLAMQGLDPVRRSMELGILIGQADARGKGFGREACALAIAFAFDHLGAHRITAGTVAGNDAMKAVFLSLGFQIEGNLRRSYWLDGTWHDAIRFGLLREEFTPEGRAK